MSLNKTPRSERLHIAIFGRRNAGKSSLINALTNQEVALVSDVLGTTTDPVFKSMELLPLGPVVIIDTAGLDDVGDLGQLRTKKTYDILNKTDISIIVLPANEEFTEFDNTIIEKIKEKNIPAILVISKIDLIEGKEINIDNIYVDWPVVRVCSNSKEGISELKKELGKIQKVDEDKFKIVADLINPGDFVVLVTPIDKAAPKGRLILPQQQVIRDIIESDAIAIVTKEHELRETLENIGKKPKLVITDSQAFLKVSADTPRDSMLTSFSILFARYKGDLIELVKGAKAIETLKDGDKVLIAEGCTHHRQSDDIGTVKIPRWLRQYTGKDVQFEFSSGHEYPENLQEYSLIIHCGSCMLNKKEVLSRINKAKEKEIPIVNYGVFISYVQGIFERALEPFPVAKLIWEE